MLKRFLLAIVVVAGLSACAPTQSPDSGAISDKVAASEPARPPSSGIEGELAVVAVAASEPTPAPQPEVGADWTGTLRPGEVLVDPVGHHQLEHQHDGNVVLYDADHRPLWSSKTVGTRTTQLVMQGDGNLVLYDVANQPVFHTATHGQGASLSVQRDGNVVVYRADRAVAWAAKHWPPKPPRPQLPAILWRIARCEGYPGYVYRDHGHSTSTASGKFGFLDGTWRSWRPPEARGYARAFHAPEHLQDQAAINLYNASGTRPWNASRHCWG